MCFGSIAVVSLPGSPSWPLMPACLAPHGHAAREIRNSCRIAPCDTIPSDPSCRANMRFHVLCNPAAKVCPMNWACLMGEGWPPLTDGQRHRLVVLWAGGRRPGCGAFRPLKGRPTVPPARGVRQQTVRIPPSACALHTMAARAFARRVRRRCTRERVSWGPPSLRKPPRTPPYVAQLKTAPCNHMVLMS